MKTIRWEKAKKQTSQLPQTAKRGGHLWYGSLLLAAGVFLCVLSAYRQLGQILPGVRILAMPRGTWLLVAGVLLLAMYRSASWQRICVHLGQLAALVCVCAVTGTLFAPLADRAVAEHEYFYERQLALEDALLALPVAELFTEDGKVTNDAPSGSKQEILTVRLSDKATENVYLRDFAANRYENGKWYADTDGFAELAGQQDMQPDEAGRWLAQYDYANAESLLSSELHTNLLSYSMESPKIYDFTVNYRHGGQLPAFRR